MPTDPYVPTPLDAEPRNEPNLAPGVHLPPAGHWRAERPGDLGPVPPKGPLLGSPGPDLGYALTLVSRARSRVALAPGEHTEDAAAIVGEIAMARAAVLDRAPVAADVDFALELMGYTEPPTSDVGEWRRPAVRGAAHSYELRRAVVDAIGRDGLRLRPAELGARLEGLRATITASTSRAREESAGAVA